ncbi:hypothetical protein [Burkholderia vietnamiensis]|uniref:hypothetical protein n=1 Tax=Burkholderia vietnamiensis TaxID=60552 RepID=UPI0018C6A6DC|nr:hypothetical protein [Burkholderia vietnamiensis]MDN8070985.1 hypothetical protein [Burkholderia vietnamiensis]HDV8350261.1 hypothetical protein [Burkholderia vietnamiensis]
MSSDQHFSSEARGFVFSWPDLYILNNRNFEIVVAYLELSAARQTIGVRPLASDHCCSLYSPSASRLRLRGAHLNKITSCLYLTFLKRFKNLIGDDFLTYPVLGKRKIDVSRVMY